MAQKLEFNAVVSTTQLNKLLDDLRSGGESAAKALNTALGGTVTKTILLETVTDSSGVRKLVATEKERLSVTDKIINQQRQLDKVQQGSVTSLRQQVNEAKQARDQVAKYSTSVGLLGGQVRTVNSEWRNANQRVSELTRQLNIASASGFWQRVKADLNLGGLASFSNGLVQITQGFQAASILAGQFLGSINQVVRAASNLQQFELAFKAIGVGASGSTQALSEVSRISLGLGVNLQNAQEAFQQLSPVILNTGGTAEDVSAIVETLSSRFAAYGISGDKARRVTNGIIQAFSKGKLQAEEFTQQIAEADPAIKTEYAKALKVAGISISGTTAELENLIRSGRITAEVLRETIPLLSKSSLLFGKLGPSASSAVDALSRGDVTIEQVQQNLQNLNELSLRRLAIAAEPAIESFLRLQAVVVDFLTNISKTGAAQSFFNLISRITDAATNLISGLLSLAQTVLGIVNAFAPLVNVLTKIPGLFELIGLAIIGKFLKPLKESGGVIGSFLSSQSNLGRRLQQVWSGIANKTFLPYVAARDAALKTAKEVSPGKVARGNDFPKLAADATAAGQAIGKAFKDPRKEAVRLENKIDALKAKISDIRSRAVATARTPVVSDAPIAGVSKEFNQALTLLKKYETGNLGFVKTQEDAQQVLGRTALAITALGNGYGTLQISPAFLRDTQALAQQDKTRAVALLNAAISSLRTNLQQLESGKTPLKGAIQQQAIAATISNLKQAETALESVKNGSAAMRQELQKKTVVSLSAKDTKDLQKYSQELRNARQARRDLNTQVAAPVTSGALDIFRRELRGSEDVLTSLRKRKIAEAQANSEIIQSGRARIRQINDLIKANGTLGRAAARAQTGVGSPIDQQSLATVQGLVAERTRLREEIDAEAAAIRRRIGAETDLNRVLGETSRFGRSVLRDTRAIGLAVDVTREKWNGYKNALRETRASIGTLTQQQAALGKQLGSLPVGSRDAAGIKREYEGLGNQIKVLQDQERQLIPVARESAQQARDAARAKRDYTRQTQSAGGAAQFFGTRLKGLGSGVTGVLGAIKGLGGELLAAFGPVGIILAAVSAAQSAYSDATASARVESEKSAEIAKVLTQRNQELAEAIKRAREEAGGTGADITPDVNVKQLSGFQLLWTELGNGIADVFKLITKESKEGAKATGNSIDQLISDIERLQKAGNTGPESFIDAQLLRPLRELGADFGIGIDIEGTQEVADISKRIRAANAQFQQFARESNEVTKSVKSNSTQIIDNINKLEQLADASADGALSNKDFVSGFDATTNSLEQEATRLQRVRDQIKEYEKLEAIGRLDPAGVKDLAALRIELESSQTALDAARDKTEKLGLETGAFANQAARTATSITGLNEALKGAQALLEGAAFGSDEFKQGAAQIFAFETAIKKSQEAAKDPITLSVGLDAESLRLAQEINDLQERRDELSKDPVTNQKQLVQLEKELAKAIADSNNTLEARSVIDVQLRVDESKFRENLQKINDQIKKDQIRIGTSINQPELRQALTQLAEFRSRVRELQAQREELRIRRQDPTLTEEQRRKLSQEDQVIAKQIQAELTKGAADLKDAAERLRQSAIDARKELASARQSLLNLKLGNLQFLPPEERRKAVQELDKEVRRIERERGIQLQTRGTPAQRLEQKQGFVNFYNQLKEGEERVAKLQKAVEDVDSALTAISTSKIGEIFGGLAEPMADVASYLTTSASASETIQIALSDIGGIGSGLESNFENAAGSIQGIANTLLNLDGQSITIGVNYSSPPPARWTGGPVSAGIQYQVNELGQEGFLSATGRLSAINRPRNALWRAPSSGMVIPADLWANMNIPTAEVRANKPASGGFSSGGGLAKIAKAIQAGLAVGGRSESVNELAAVQAHQALQIGKLGRAVDDLVSKDWNVNVKVKNVGNATFLEALNHRM